MSLDFEKICRVCLEANRETSDIFTSYYAKRNAMYNEMISYCTKLLLFPEDGLPRLICIECSKLLKCSYSFYVQCEESDKKLRSYAEKADQTGSVSVSHSGVSSQYEVKVEEQNEDVPGFPFIFKDSTDNQTENKNGENNLLAILADEELKEIKIEPCYNENEEDDSHWDAEDDNIILRDIQQAKQKNKELENVKDKPKKKRGPKKKGSVLPEEALDSKLPLQCDECGKLISTRSNLRAHMMCHTDLRPHKCTECDATFKGYSALYQHRRVHTGETPYHCEYCPKQFARRTGLVHHVRIHTGERSFGCELCNKRFVQSGQLAVHMKRHQGDKSFLCSDCGKGFPIRADLVVHMRVHNGEKPYNCPLCTKTFATSGNLSIHVRIHNQEIRYKCKECQRGFVSRSSYNVHVKRHKGQRDYPCECGKTFYTSSALKQHKVVHTGEKRYQCKICQKKFTQTSHVARHYKRDHVKPNTPLPPPDSYRVTVTEHRVANKLQPSMNRLQPSVNRLQPSVNRLVDDNDKMPCEET